MTPNPEIRLPDKLLHVVHVAWVIITLLAIGIFALGLPLRYGELQQLCHDPIEICQKNSNLLYPQNVQALADRGLSIEFYAAHRIVVALITAVVFCSVGLLIVARKFDSWLALIVALFLITFGTQGGFWQAAARGYPLLQLPALWLTIINWATFALFISLFPNGQFVPRWTRWFVLIWTLMFAAPQSILEQLPDSLLGIIFPIFFLLSIIIPVYRYRYVSNLLEQQQTKWVVYGLTIAMAGALIIWVLVVVPNPTSQYDLASGYFAQQTLTQLLVLCIPLSIGIAVLYSRLWDIDIIIRKTVQYSVLTGLLGLVYFGCVVLLQNLFFGNQTSEIAIVLSTLLIAALFRPLRHRIQDFIDGRFYRKKYDAAQVLADFTKTCQDETDMEALTAELLRIIQETLQPGTVTIWLKPTSQKEWGQGR